MIKEQINTALKDKIARSSITNLFIKPISLILSFIYTPLLLSYLGDEKYGLWATILSVTNWINYCDIGIGHGLRNLLARQIAQEKYEDAKKAISTAYVCMTGIAFAILVVLVLLSFFLDWNEVFNSSIDMNLPVLITFVFICINFVLALSNTIFYALQKSEVVSLRNILMQVINIVGILILSKVSSGSITLIAIVFGAGTMVTYIVNTVNIVKNYSFARIKIKYFEKDYVRIICNTGLKFFVIQISVIFMYTVDNILITRLFGAAAVTPYSMIDKIYNTGYGFLTALMVPIWSASTEALTKRNYNWFDTTIKKLNIITFIFAIGCIFIGFIFEPFSNIWLGQSLDYPDGLLAVMVIYYILQAFQNPYCQMNNGIGALNGQMILGIIQGGLNIPLSIFLATTCGMGVVGIKLATTLLMAVGAIFQPTYYYIMMAKMKKS